ncbi:MAG: hypothetical protein QOJ79_2550 [Actinomycetota bacterium]|jgi:hypothetical protein|nr:hypothetical protein [Actinomycetota bacterium]
MSLFDDDVAHATPRRGSDWEQHRLHRHPQSGPPGDEVGMLALSGFVLARTAEVVVAVRGITAYSDGLHIAVVVIFADHARSEDMAYSLQEYSRSPGRFRVGLAFSDGRTATSGQRDSPDVEQVGSAQFKLLGSSQRDLMWSADYWLWPLPSPGPLVVGCRWPDRGIPETLVQIDSEPLLTASAQSRSVWDMTE